MSVMNENTIVKVLNCIQQYQVDTGRSPRYREIMRLCRLPSIGQVQRCIRTLKERGEIESENDGKVSLDYRFSGNVVGLPLIGAIACGSPITAVENYEGVFRLPEELVGSGNFMLRARGSSMTGVGIRNNDFLIIREQQTADYGQIVAVCIGDEATVKTFQPQRDKIILHAENPRYKDIEVYPDETDNFRILGVVVGSFHRFH